MRELGFLYPSSMPAPSDTCIFLQPCLNLLYFTEMDHRSFQWSFQRRLYLWDMVYNSLISELLNSSSFWNCWFYFQAMFVQIQRTYLSVSNIFELFWVCTPFPGSVWSLSVNPPIKNVHLCNFLPGIAFCDFYIALCCWGIVSHLPGC
jgi:hypothetical protein